MYNIKERYDGLPPRERRRILRLYMRKFDRSRGQFYADLNRTELSGRRLAFFAGVFGCNVEDLYREIGLAKRLSA